ncbi:MULTISPECIES: AAA family ATPase [Amycolatopsis]|uniref:AAA family ATPase n=1 Tax=Amycolatopsis TaxID=1813 RepID=UPI003083F97E
MPRLILLNGPPACGRSTLAGRYVDEHPLALNLDVDRLRNLIGRRRDDPRAAGRLARGVALAAARTHLASGHDVVIPQFLGRTPFIEQLEGLARGGRHVPRDRAARQQGEHGEALR